MAGRRGDASSARRCFGADQHRKLLAAGDESDIPAVARDAVICFALYTVHDKRLKMSVHLYPLADDEPHEVRLDVMQSGAWSEIARTDVHPVGWTATFRVDNWNTGRDVKYRVRHALGSSYEGLIRRDPRDKQVIVAAAFTGNSPGPGGGMISKQDVVENILKIDPDVLLFTGDQVYNHRRHTEHWLRFGETFGRMMRDRPTVCLPDDHDIGQGNLWGGGGRKVDLDTKGGYVRPVEYVKPRRATADFAPARSLRSDSHRTGYRGLLHLAQCGRNRFRAAGRS